MLRRLLDYKRQILIYLLGILTGATIFYAYNKFTDPGELPGDEEEKHLGPSGLINPLLDCTTFPHRKEKGVYSFGYFADDIKDYVRKVTNHIDIQNISIYFRDLANGSTFGVNQDVPFKPGSLLKVPLVIGYLKKSEKDPTILQKTIKFENEALLKIYDLQSQTPSKKLEIGKSYTIKELIEAAILRSDNVAANMLEHYDKRASMIQISGEMDIPIHTGIPPLRNITIKEYAGFFRMLYNASYLTHENSNYLLDLLTESEFKDGLLIGVDPGVVVAHKFGESIDREDPSIHFFSECGIVYYPKRPYLLCITMRGKNEAQLIKSIQEISALVFKKVRNYFE